MLKIILNLFVLVLLFNGCTHINTYQQYYRNNGNAIQFSKPNVDTEPEILTNLNYDDIVKNRKNLLQDGFNVIGTSEFTGTEIHSKYEDIKFIANQLQAQKVLSYSKSLGQINGGSVSTYVGYGVYMNTPIVTNRFAYYAEYYQISKKKSCGCYVMDLTDDMKRKIGSNRGVMIDSIVKKSPAYESNLISGDIILTMNEVPIDDKEYFYDLLTKNYGKEVIFYIYRDGKYLSIRLKLNNPDV